jgi:hypothetical protein
MAELEINVNNIKKIQISDFLNKKIDMTGLEIKTKQDADGYWLVIKGTYDKLNTINELLKTKQIKTNLMA